MFSIQIIPPEQQANQVFDESKQVEDAHTATIHAGSMNFLSWAYVTEDLYYPTHRKGGFDCYIYELTQSHQGGDCVGTLRSIHEGDLIIMQSGSTNYPVVKRIGAGFSAFEFWFSEDGLLKGTEKASFLKISAAQFPVRVLDGVVIRQLFGDDAPVAHVNQLRIFELRIPIQSIFHYRLMRQHQVGVYVISGDGLINEYAYHAGDFIELSQNDDSELFVRFEPVNCTESYLIAMDFPS